MLGPREEESGSEGHIKPECDLGRATRRACDCWELEEYLGLAGRAKTRRSAKSRLVVAREAERPAQIDAIPVEKLRSKSGILVSSVLLSFSSLRQLILPPQT